MRHHFVVNFRVICGGNYFNHCDRTMFPSHIHVSRCYVCKLMAKFWKNAFTYLWFCWQLFKSQWLIFWNYVLKMKDRNLKKCHQITVVSADTQSTSRIYLLYLILTDWLDLFRSTMSASWERGAWNDHFYVNGLVRYISGTQNNLNDHLSIFYNMVNG